MKVVQMWVCTRNEWWLGLLHTAQVYSTANAYCICTYISCCITYIRVYFLYNNNCRSYQMLYTGSSYISLPSTCCCCISYELKMNSMNKVMRRVVKTQWRYWLATLNERKHCSQMPTDEWKYTNDEKRSRLCRDFISYAWIMPAGMLKPGVSMIIASSMIKIIESNHNMGK